MPICGQYTSVIYNQTKQFNKRYIKKKENLEIFGNKTELHRKKMHLKKKDNRTCSQQELVIYPKKESVPTHLDHNDVLNKN